MHAGRISQSWNFSEIMMAAYTAPYKVLFIVLLTPCWIPVGTLMKLIGTNLGSGSNLLFTLSMLC